jgi:hypothetical protein
LGNGESESPRPKTFLPEARSDSRSRKVGIADDDGSGAEGRLTLYIYLIYSLFEEGYMKKQFSIILIVLLFSLFSFSSNAELNVKIKAGVVMKSGDVKNIARQDIYILKADVMAIWEKNTPNIINRRIIETDVKKAADYDNKIAAYQSQIDKYQSLSYERTAKKEKLLEDIRTQLKQNLKESRDLGNKWGVNDMFDKLLNYYLGDFDYLKSCMEEADKKYLDLLNRQITEEFNTTFRAQYEKFKKINEVMEKLEKENKTENQSSKINEIIKERDSFKKDIEEKISKKEIDARNIFLYQRDERDKAFIGMLKQNIILVAKTNLNGEATIKVAKGQYYIFFVATIADNTIMWNSRTDIFSDNQYIELSNDNAYRLSSNIAKEVWDVIYKN